MSITLVIPARLESTRLPRKILLDLEGAPMLQRVWEQASKMRQATRILIATDSEEVRERAEGWGAEVAMTDPACPSGTDRIASLVDQLDADFILNLQGDEPLVPPALLDQMVETWQTGGQPIITPVYRLTDRASLDNPNRVKVVRAADGRALYFSRAPIPFRRGAESDAPPDPTLHWGHIGLYGYSREVLTRYPSLPPSALEEAERLEQLRLLEHGWTIQTVVTEYHPPGVDTAEDLERVRALWRQQFLG